MKLKNIDLVANRIKEAIEREEQIILFGDSDMDGVSATVIAKEAISNAAFFLNKKLHISAYFPDRKKEGYGFNENVLDYIIKKYPSKALVITLDCGITNFEEIKKARKKGFEVIIIDHHQPVVDGLPEADIIVDPKQEGDDYPFKDFSNAGLSFKLAEELLGERMPSLLKESLLELTAMATIADMMPEKDENIDYIYQGLSKIENSQRPILKAFFTIFNPEEFNSKKDIIYKINSCFNVANIDSDHVSFLYYVLTETDVEAAKEYAKELLEESNRRHLEIYALFDDAKNVIDSKIGNRIIFEGSPNWSIEYLGAVASKLTLLYNKPVFIYQRYDDFSRGTVRLPKKYDAVKAMESCKQLLKTFGGHPPAAGFTVINSNLDKFKSALIAYFNKVDSE
ncbi:MAG: DHH family phosphoesterase [Candidatus Pacebacteria bacterium]|nr:DHH family phosphoesterase [Candidatus Paceibacterota bacterium]